MIITRTPFRISFAGGGTDLREFYSKEPGRVLSSSIKNYIYVILVGPQLIMILVAVLVFGHVKTQISLEVILKTPTL